MRELPEISCSLLSQTPPPTVTLCASHLLRSLFLVCINREAVNGLDSRIVYNVQTEARTGM